MKGFVFGFLLAGVLLFFPSSKKRVSQPIDFSHKLHIENGLVCEDCHVGVNQAIHATIPNIEVCGDCHEEAMGDSEEEKKVVAAIEKEERIPWVQIHKLRPDLFFSHRRHVVIGEIPCKTCHGEVEKKIHPFTKPYRRLRMGFCLDCHYKHGMPRDCSACHR